MTEAKDMKRAERRQCLSNKRNKAKLLYPGVKHPERFADNLTTCSGPCCGNPRRHFKERTIQERRFKDKAAFGEGL